MDILTALGIAALMYLVWAPKVSALLLWAALLLGGIVWALAGAQSLAALLIVFTAAFLTPLKASRLQR
jgi:uncharacterized membrane protein